MLVDGMTAANDLGLSCAVPGRITIHSDARLKPVRLGNQTIVFRPTAATKLYWAGRPAMRMVQAIHWLRPKLDTPEDERRIQHQFASLLSDPNLRRDLEAGLATLPLWMQNFIRNLVIAPLHPSLSTKPKAARAGKTPKP
jgi:hypothetical protein